MPNIKIRNFKGLNTNYDSADIDIEFFIQYKDICTKYGYIVPEKVTIQKFKEINDLILIKEIILDNDKLSMDVINDGNWSKFESNYIQNLQKYLLVISKTDIQLYYNNNRVMLEGLHITVELKEAKVINKNGIAKLILKDGYNKTTIYKISLLNRKSRYIGFVSELSSLFIEKINPIKKEQFNFTINQYYKTNGTYYDSTILENEIFIPGTKLYPKIDIDNEILVNPFKGLAGNYVYQENLDNYRIALFSNYGKGEEAGRTYYNLLQGRKFQLVDLRTNSPINNFNRDMNIVGLGCPNRNELGFIKYSDNMYYIPESSLQYILHGTEWTTKWTNIWFGSLNIDYQGNNKYLWVYYDNNTNSVAYQTNPRFLQLGIGGINWYRFTEIELDKFIKYINDNNYNTDMVYINKQVDIDAEGFNTALEDGGNVINSKLEIISTCIVDNVNEFVCSYNAYSVKQILTKFVISLSWDSYLSNLQALSNEVNKIVFYYRLNPNDDFQQFQIVDLQAKYNEFSNVFVLSLNSNTGIYLTQTIGYAYQPEDYQDNNPNKILVAPNDIIDINGIQMALYGQNIMYPAVGRGGILQDIYYKFNTVPDIEGDWLVNINNNLGVYNKDTNTLYLVENRTQEGIMIFYLKDSVPYIINKEQDIIYTPLGIIIMTNKGIILFDGKNITLISENINNLVENDFKISNIFYDNYNQQLHFINTKWYRYDFMTKTWNEFSLPFYFDNGLDLEILPKELINFNNKLYIRNDNILYEIIYNNKANAYLELVKFQNGQDNIKIGIEEILYDDEIKGYRSITKKPIQLDKIKLLDYLTFSTEFDSKLYSLELKVRVEEYDNMILPKQLRG